MIYKSKHKARHMKHTIHPLKTKTLALFMILATIVTIMPIGIQPTFAEPGYLYTVDESVIWNYQSQFEDYEGEDIIISVPLEDLEWNTPPSIIHSEYDSRAYSAANSKKFNGYSTPEHVVFDNNALRFLGYDIKPYMDMVFTEEYYGGFDSLSFIMRPVVMNFHTFSETGLLFNGSFSGQYYTGYALILKCGNMERMLSNGNATISLVYCNNEKMDGSSYSPGTLASSRTLIGTCKTDINNLTTPAFSIRIDKYAEGEGFMLYLDGQMVVDVPVPKSSGDGFGFFTGYYGHDCRILTVIEYEQVETTVNVAPVETYATVKFVDVKTGTELAQPQTVPDNAVKSYARDEFKVTAPQNIGDYRYVRASRNSLDPITYKKDSAENVITLYYNAEVDVSKSASVYDVAGNGDPDSPVGVAEGDTIEYTIDVYNPKTTAEVPAASTFTDIWTGKDHTIARDSNGDIYVWGLNSNGQLGLGTDTANKTTPTKNDFLSALEITNVWVGDNHNFARTEGGDIYVWGQNGYWQLGLGHSNNVTEPEKNNDLSDLDIKNIWAGSNHNIARDSNGDYYVWGSNSDGRLGLGDSTTASHIDTPTPNTTLKDKGIVDIWVGGRHNIALDGDGKLYVWGYNGSYQLGLGTDSTSRNTPTLNTTLSGVFITNVWVGEDHNIARDLNGNYYGWGSNSNGELGLGNTTTYITTPTPNTTLKTLNIKDIWAGGQHTIARTGGGEYYVWGSNSNRQLGLGADTANKHTPAENDTLKTLGIKDIWVGGSHNIARDSNGDIYVWGYNSDGRLGLGDITNKTTPTKNIALSCVFTDIWTGFNHSIARDLNGDYYVWGYNYYGQLGLGDTTNRTVPTKNDTLREKGITDIWMGESHTIARASDGKYYVWGRNTSGQLGMSGTRTTPTENTNLGNKGITDIWVGSNHNIARGSDGKYYVWGQNTDGQLGMSGTITTPTENTNLGNKGITDIWVGGYHNIACDSDGNYYVWGQNTSGQLGTGGTTNITPPDPNPNLDSLGITDIYLGDSYSIARTLSGEINVWGQNTSGQLGLEGDTDNKNTPTVNDALKNLNIAAIRAGGNYVVARASNGKIYTWGDNVYGQLGLGTSGNGVKKTSPTRGPVLRSYVKPFIVTDLLPEGLSLFKSGDVPVYSVTDEAGNPVDVGNLTVSVDEESGRERITFEFTILPHGITQFHFTATVDDNGYFENTGQFYDSTADKTYDSNATYHATGIYTVTEKYQAYGDAQGNPLQANTFRRYNANLITDPDDPGYDHDNPPTDDEIHYSPYMSTMRPITDSAGNVWRYYGYKRVDADDELIAGQPPNGIVDWDNPSSDSEYPWCWKNVAEDHQIILYFVKDVTVQIDYRDVDGIVTGDLKQPSRASASFQENYYMAVSHMNSIDGIWNYAGYYSLDGGATVEEGVPPTPTYKADDMTGDKHIVLYFTQNPAVTVQYREYRTDLQDRQNSQMLFYKDVNKETNEETFINKETFIVAIGTDFDPMEQPTVADAIQNGVSSIIDKQYKIYQGWSDDGGTTVHLGENSPEFKNLDGNKNIILYFSTTYIITEKFHTIDSPFDSLTPDINTLVLGGDTFTGVPPLKILDGQWCWEYVGYRMGTDQHDLLRNDDDENYDPPVIHNVAGDETIIYVYEKGEPSTDVTVIERFREKDNTGNILKDDVQTNVTMDTELGMEFPGSYTGTITPDQQSTKYTYWGYQIDNDDPVEGAFPGIKVDSGHTITYLYRVGCPTIHIRQIVVDPIDGLEKPVGNDKGFFRLTNNNKTVHVTGPSGIEATTDYAEYFLTIGGDWYYTVQGIIPQYYMYYGYYANSGNDPDAKHKESDECETGAIVLNYNDETEWWVTIYIKPPNSPGDYDWGFKTNEVGTILPPTP